MRRVFSPHHKLNWKSSLEENAKLTLGRAILHAESQFMLSDYRFSQFEPMKTIGAINQKEVLRNAIAESNGKQSLEVRVIVSESGCPSCCAVGVDAAPPQGALLRTTGPVFGLPYPPPQSWPPGDPLLSIRIGLPIMLCGRGRRCTSTGGPAQNNGPCFWPALPSPPQLGPSGPPIVEHNRVAHHAVRSASTLHLHREPCSQQRALFLACPTLPPKVGPQWTPYCRSKSGCLSCCAVGVDAAPPQGALLRTTGPVFGLPYPPPHS